MEGVNTVGFPMEKISAVDILTLLSLGVKVGLGAMLAEASQVSFRGVLTSHLGLAS